MASPNVTLVLGIIGSGKTTLCNELGVELDALVLKEEAQEDGNRLIELFYEDMTRHAFHLQVSQLARRFRQHALAQWWALNGNGPVVIDGGFWLDTCFARMIVEAKLMSELEFETYRLLFSNMTSVVLHPTFVVRVNTAPEVAKSRVAARAEAHPERRGEADRVDVEYLTALDRQITGLCGEFQAMGVHVESVFWDEDRKDAGHREQAVKGLARLIRQYTPPDPFLRHWRRRVG